jgi:hypothetical protein
MPRQEIFAFRCHVLHLFAADSEHKHKEAVDEAARNGRPVWCKRPLPAQALKYAVDDVRILNKFVSMLVCALHIRLELGNCSCSFWKLVSVRCGFTSAKPRNG